MDNMPILEGLLKYINEDNISFHMPGHKNNKKNFKELEIIRENLYKIDATEVSGLDNLHCPKEMILNSQKKAAKTFGAKESFFLVNGSTCGIYSMVLGITKPKDKIIMQRNCHRSVYTACFLGDLNPIFINPSVLDEFNIAVSIDEEEIIKVIEKNKDAKAIVLTYPTYYGTCCNLEKIIKKAHSFNIPVLIDEAHGAHFYFNEKLPKGAMLYGADACTISMHKTTPSLTQTAILNVGNINSEGIKFMLKTYQTTSPSYVFLASLDSARYIMETKGKKLIDELIEDIEVFKAKIEDIGAFKILDSSYIGKANIFDIDKTRIVISSKIGGKNVEHTLRHKYHIQVEMSDINNIVLICSIGNNKKDLENLYIALKDISKNEKLKYKEEFNFKEIGYKTIMNMREAYYKKGRKVKLKDAINLISREMVVPYPPGIPILIPGEIITYDIIEYIKYIKDKGIELSGMEDNNAEYIDIVDF